MGITDEDILCLEIAGLCHDLGHGPFSHLFDGRILPRLNKSHEFIHEHASIGILELLIAENNLFPVFEAHNLTRDDIHFIQELILGDSSDAPVGFNWVGRGEKTFLYDILANKRNGIDVDKFDYFARDCHGLGLTKSFDAKRLMKFARFVAYFSSYSNGSGGALIVSPYHRRVFPVTRSSTALEICFHLKEAWNIHEVSITYLCNKFLRFPNAYCLYMV